MVRRLLRVEILHLRGVCFSVPYFIVAWTLGPELPSLIGGLIGLGILITAPSGASAFPKPPGTSARMKSGRLLDRQHRRQRQAEFHPHMTQFRAWLPYAIIGLILVLTRIGTRPQGVARLSSASSTSSAISVTHPSTTCSCPARFPSRWSPS
ncbi:MAG: L-lactate permease [Bilophila wadsworthia]